MESKKWKFPTSLGMCIAPHRCLFAVIECTTIDTPREVTAILIRPFTYDSEVHTVSGRKGRITIENLTPQLSDGECLEQRRWIEEGLYEVFVKYENRCEKNSGFGAAAV